MAPCYASGPMDLLWCGARASLDRWRSRAAWPGTEAGPGPRDRLDQYVREVARAAPGSPAAEGPHARAAAAILRYDVFPPELAVRVVEREPVREGDVVGLRYRLGPGLDLFFASRVVEVFDAPAEGVHRTGFRYRTLEGHPELGEETFSVETELASGIVRVALRAWSRPGTLLSRLGAPIARRLQVGASEAGAARLAAIARGSASEGGFTRP